MITKEYIVAKKVELTDKFNKIETQRQKWLDDAKKAHEILLGLQGAYAQLVELEKTLESDNKKEEVEKPIENVVK